MYVYANQFYSHFENDLSSVVAIIDDKCPNIKQDNMYPTNLHTCYTPKLVSLLENVPNFQLLTSKLILISQT